MATKECLCLTPRNVCATIYQGCRHLPSLRGLATVGGNSRYFWALANAQFSSTFIWLRSLLHFYIVLSPLSSGAKNALLRSDCFNETLPPIFWGMVGVNAHTYMHTVMGTTEDHWGPQCTIIGFFLQMVLSVFILFLKITQFYKKTLYFPQVSLNLGRFLHLEA